LVDFRQTLDLNEPILILRIRPQSKVSEECHRGVQTTS
jgi:hypothetical protein